MKTVLILGATYAQAPFVKVCQQLGYHAIVASIPGHYPAFEIADEIAHIDVSDKEAVLAYARERKVDGIVSNPTEVTTIPLA